MHIIDSHFHYFPPAFFERLCSRTAYPRAERNARNGYSYFRQQGQAPALNLGAQWFDLDRLLERMNADGHEVEVVSSLGPLSAHFSDVPPGQGRTDAMLWNEEIAEAQRRHPGRFWGLGAVPLTDGKIAIEILDHAVKDLGLLGVNIPTSVGEDGRIDASELEAFYDRVEELGTVLYLHPCDTMLSDILEGYDGLLFISLGRVMDVSIAASRLVFSGIMERHPDLKLYMSHTGGVLPYQSGRLDKSTPQAGVGSFSRSSQLPQPPSTYIKRIYTDIVQPNVAGMRFAIDYFGVDHIIYGTDYPCWDPSIALNMFNEAGLSEEDQQKIFYFNGKRFFGIPDSAAAKSAA